MTDSPTKPVAPLSDEAVAEKSRMFPIQRSTPIRWELAQRAYDTYARLFGSAQSLERLAQRGGFGLQEFACLFGGHYPEKGHHECIEKADAVGRLITDLESRLAQVEKERNKLRADLELGEEP